MKKSLLKILALAVSASALSGCSLSDIFGGGDDKETTGIKLVDYSKTVALNTEYKFDGKVYLVYEDETEKEVTKDCEYSTLDTSKVGDATFTVRYEASKYIYNKTAHVTVVGLDSLTVQADTSSVQLGGTYTFSGSVLANYSDGSHKVVTNLATFDYSKIDNQTVGQYPVTVSFEEGGTKVSDTFNVSVYDGKKLSSIALSDDYTKQIEKGQTYVFDGKVTATYTIVGTSSTVQENIPLDDENLTIGSVSTSSVGKKNFTVSFKDVNYNITKSATGSVTVISTVTAISGADVTVGVNRSSTINLTFTPSDATTKGVRYTSNNTSIATVDQTGKVTGQAVGKTTILVESTEVENVSTLVNISVEEVVQDAWTILIYMCGSNLESDSRQGGAATEDLQEIASVSGQPEGVNIVVQAGGASSWKSTYSSVIKANTRNRIHLKNKTYVRDDSSTQTKENMGDAKTLQSFITWGIETYPADNIGLIFWNHGGAITGACFDEQYSDDGLTPDEMIEGISKAKATTGYSKKFEFIGYDCCLMQFHDLAGLNAPYAKYQVASEESEWGYGWKYDEWIDDVYASKSTEQICTSIVDSFIAETDDKYPSWYGETSDQTLSYLDLSKWDAYETAWEDMASTLNSAVSSWGTFSNVLQSCKRYGDEYDLFDIGHFITKMRSSSSFKNNSTLMNKLTAVETAYGQLVAHEGHGHNATNSSGLALFAPVSGQMVSDYYPETVTTLQTWRSFCVNKGNWYTDNGGWGGWGW